MYRLPRFRPNKLRSCVLALFAALLFAAPAWAQSFQNVTVPVQGQFATILQNQKFSFFASGAAGHTNAYIMAIQPGSALTLYVTAKNATWTSSDTLNINFYTNGNPAVQGCLVNSGGLTTDGWTPTVASTFQNGLPTGTAGQVSHLTFGLPQTAFVTTGILNASQVCVQVINNSTGGANDTFDMYASFTPNALATGASVGTGGFQCSGVGGVGGGFTVPAGVGATFPVPCDNASAAGGGFLIGRQISNALFQNLGVWGNVMDSSNGLSTLDVQITALDNTATARPLQVAQNATAIDVSGGAPPAGSLLSSDAGVNATHIFVPVTSNTQAVITNSPTQFVGGIGRNCSYVQSVTGSITGTGPTLDTYIQESVDNGATWMDRVHFLQVTAVNNQRAVTINDPAGGLVPVATTDRTLAAGTVINGPLTANVRVAFVVGGTTPSFGSVAIFINCD